MVRQGIDEFTDLRSDELPRPIFRPHNPRVLLLDEPTAGVSHIAALSTAALAAGWGGEGVSVSVNA
jgi:hypothetical protein